MYQVSRLNNGLTIATAEMPHMASVSLGLWVGVGGRYEPAPLTGVSHFIEHLLFNGTRKRSAKEISRAVESIGGYLNAFTGEESTCFYSKGLHGRLEELLEVLLDMFLHSTFAPGEIDKERGVIKEELAMYLDQPQHHVHELLNEILWPEHPLGRSLTGTEKTLDALGRRELVGYQRQNYVASSTLLIVAGNLRHENVTKAVSRLASQFPVGNRPRFLPVQDQQSQSRIRLHTKDTSQTQLALGIRACSRHDERRYALRLLNTLLGENMSSRLFQVVREDHGLAYSISSSLSLFDDVGALTISVGLDTGQLRQAMKLIRRELRRFYEAAPTARELRDARDYLIGQIDLSLESTENQMMWLGDQLIGYGKIIPPAQIKKRLSEVNPAQIRAVAREFLRPEHMNLALVSPLKSDAGLARMLRG